MLPVARAATVRELDRVTIEEIGVPGRQLMEIAGREAAEQVHRRWPGAPTAVLCGPGNNGGDGYVVARWLKLWGHPIRLWASAETKTLDATLNRDLCERMGLQPVSLAEATDGANVLVDALLGTGQDRAPRGRILKGVEAIRVHKKAGGPVVALDLPTGLSADTGQPLGEADAVVEADLTITFGRWKPGLLCMPGRQLAGEIELVDIGLDLAGAHDPALLKPDGLLLEPADVRSWLPRLDPGGAKWNRGHVAVRAGGGASVLASHGAFAVGAGLVTLLAPRQAWAALHGLRPEVILAEPEALNPKRQDVVVVGPGLGTDEVQVVVELWEGFPGAVVADGDALTILSKQKVQPPDGTVRVITPHAAEAARLLGCEREAVERDRFSAIKALERFGLPVLKGAFTLIGGGIPWVSPTGSPRLATAGTGDVLAGMIGGLLSRRLEPRSACALATWLHGQAGERIRENGTASDVLAEVRLEIESKGSGS